jgi:hypothetical protein
VCFVTFMISADSRLSTRWFTSNNTVALGFHSWTLFEICWTTPKLWGLQITVEVPTARSVQTWGCINISWVIFWRRFKCPCQSKFHQDTYSPATRSGMDYSNLSGRDLNLMFTNIARYAQQLFVAFSAVSCPIVIRDFQFY